MNGSCKCGNLPWDECPSNCNYVDYQILLTNYNKLKQENDELWELFKNFTYTLNEFSSTEDFLMALIKIEKIQDKYGK